MTAQNLAIVFGPNLFRYFFFFLTFVVLILVRRGDNFNQFNTPIVMFLINHSAQLFSSAGSLMSSVHFSS